MDLLSKGLGRERESGNRAQGSWAHALEQAGHQGSSLLEARLARWAHPTNGLNLLLGQVTEEPNGSGSRSHTESSGSIKKKGSSAALASSPTCKDTGRSRSSRSIIRDSRYVALLATIYRLTIGICQPILQLSPIKNIEMARVIGEGSGLEPPTSSIISLMMTRAWRVIHTVGPKYAVKYQTAAENALRFSGLKVKDSLRDDRRYKCVKQEERDGLK
ncbi:hypothetical protein V6N11_022036 [Hibiscus sabdariffa]|uniref:Uncharacterized protein n=1 Tax=Hibiscus sabdariffa TaxID=183260 RepID=A0ABR2TIN9_9ROSI